MSNGTSRPHNTYYIKGVVHQNNRNTIYTRPVMVHYFIVADILAINNIIFILRPFYATDIMIIP